MTLSYGQFCRFWGKGFLLAAIIAAIAGLLTGDGEWGWYAVSRRGSSAGGCGGISCDGKTDSGRGAGVRAGVIGIVYSMNPAGILSV